MDVGNAVRVPKAVKYHSNCRRNRDCPRGLGPRISHTAQSCTLPLDHCTRPTEIVEANVKQLLVFILYLLLRKRDVISR